MPRTKAPSKMQVTWLGWAGVELEFEGDTLVIDPLHDARAAFAPLGKGAATMPVPRVRPATPERAVAGLLTHLHRDHADADALQAALRTGGVVYEPPVGTGDRIDNLGLAQSDTELMHAGLLRRHVQPWSVHEVAPFQITALPAADGLGDPQLSWAVEAGGVRVLHLGDTLFHGWWWRIARAAGPFDAVFVPVNGASLSFPHRQPSSPLPGVLDPAQAAVAVSLLGAKLAVPIHAEGYELDGIYEPVDGAIAAFADEAARRGVEVLRPRLGDAFTLAPAPVGLPSVPSRAERKLNG